MNVCYFHCLYTISSNVSSLFASLILIRFLPLKAKKYDVQLNCCNLKLTSLSMQKKISMNVFFVKPGFHISQFIGDLLFGIVEGENNFRNTKDFIHR